MPATSRSHTGRGRKATGGKRRKPKAPYMRKTTKRGAYKKNAKSNMVKRRAPMTETKSRTHEDVRFEFPSLPDRNELDTYDTPHLSMAPDSFLCLKQGLDEHQMLGRSLFSKYLNMKIQIRFPQNAFQIGVDNKIILSFPQNYELIWGWVPNPTGYTGQTTPKANEATLDDVHSHMNLRFVDYFNEHQDFLRFIPKRAATIRITGRRKVRPDLRRYSTAPASLSSDDSTFLGSVPDWTTQIKWNTMKKIHYEPTINIDGQDSTGLYPNYHWLPFCTLVNWDYAKVEAVAGSGAAKESERKRYQPAVAWNDIHYFTDS